MTATDAAPADVRLEGVVKRFDGLVAVDGISVDVPRGSFFALLGPSGCGKTTTLRMIGGFEEPDEGRILLGDQDVVGLPPYKRDVNTVFQSYALFPHMSIEDNVGFGLERKGVAKEELKGRVAEMLELVGLAGFGKRKPKQLSGGQQQRVALGRALVNHPRVLLLDEPLGALDMKLRKQMQLELKRIQQEIGITFVHVTHDQEEAMTMADSIAVMNQGRIEQLGPPQGLYERPGDRVRSGLPGRVEPPCRDRRGRGRDPARRRDSRPRATSTGARAGRGGCEAGEDHDRGRWRRERASGHGRRDRVHRRRDTGRRTNGGGHRARVRTEHRLGRARARSGPTVVLSWAPESTFVVDRDASTNRGGDDEPRLTRQELLRRGAAGGALLAFPSLLAACGGGDGGGESEAAS